MTQTSVKTVLPLTPPPASISRLDLIKIENYLYHSIFMPLKMDRKKFEYFIGIVLKTVQEKKTEINTIQNLIYEYLNTDDNLLQKSKLDKYYQNNGLLSFLSILIINKIEPEKLYSDHLLSIKFNKKIIVCSMEYKGCTWKGQFKDLDDHFKKNCEFYRNQNDNNNNQEKQVIYK